MADIIIPEPGGGPPTPTIPDVALELQVMRQQTHDFIWWNPRSVELRRPARVSDGVGGWKNVKPTPTLNPQTFRLITQTESVTAVQRGVEGEEISPEFVLLGEWDADVEADDWFDLDGRRYELRYVRGDRRYEVWAGVEYRG